MTPQKIALLTDSCADLSPQLAAENQVFVVPLRILCKDGEYRDGVDIHAADIYARLRSGELPQTPCPPLRTFRTPLTPSPRRGMTGSSP